MIKNCCIRGLEIWALTIGASYAIFFTTMTGGSQGNMEEYPKLTKQSADINMTM